MGDDRRQERPEGGGEGRRRGDRLVFIYEGGQWGVLKRDAEDNQQHDKTPSATKYAMRVLFFSISVITSSDFDIFIVTCFARGCQDFVSFPKMQF